MKRARLVDWDLQLPDFANPAVLLRMVVLSNVCMLIGAILKQGQYWAPYESFLVASAVGQPALVLSMLVLGLAWPRTAAKWRSLLALFAGPLAVGAVSILYPQPTWAGTLGAMANAQIVAILLCMYFDWRHRRLSPAVAEARLEALVSRMRPHFLFNAINGIVMLLHKSPSDAEEALLDLADVFRALLKESSGLSTLSEEIALTEKYLRIEKMRFDQRMTVRVNYEPGCAEALIPTMLLQPLVENAVIHGIESVGSGIIDINAFVKDERLFLVIENPFSVPGASGRIRPSNGMAMDNIKQRLDLLYDLDARLTAGPKGNDLWRVCIQLPLKLKQPAKHPLSARP